MADTVTIGVKIKADSKALNPLVNGFNKLNTAIIGVSAGVFAAKKAFDQIIAIGERGATIEYLSTRFDRLADAMGTTSEVMLGKLHEATRGMISDADLVEKAGQIMALGLMKTEEQTVRLVKVAAGLGMDMNQLVLTLTNQTVMRFDQLGVRVDGFKDKVAGLKAAGMDASDAFKEAFLAQAEEQLAIIGEKADSSVGSYERLRVAFKNLGDTVASDLSPAITRAVDAMVLLLNWNKKIDFLFADHEVVMRETAGSYDEYWREMVRAGLEGKKFDQIQRQMAEALLAGTLTAEQAEVALQALALQNGFYTEGAWEGARASADMAEQLRAIPEAADTSPLRDYTLEMAGLKDAINGAIKKEFESFVKSMDTIHDKTEAAREKLAELLKLPPTDQTANDIETVRQEIEDLGEEARDAAAKHKEAMASIVWDFQYAAAMADGTISQIEYDTLYSFADAMEILDTATLDAKYALDAMNEAVAANESNAYKLDDAMVMLTEALLDGSLAAGELQRILDYLNGKKFSAEFILKSSGLTNNLFQTLGVHPKMEAQGGPVFAGQPYVVGEQGWEPFVPAVNGRILSHEDTMQAIREAFGGMQAGNQKTWNINFYGRDGEAIMQDLRMLDAMGGY